VEVSSSTGAGRGLLNLTMSNADGDFDNVTWMRDSEEHNQSSSPFAAETTLPHRNSGGRRSSSMSEEPQAGENADAVDLGGIGDGSLDCTVDTPQKENDGTKDAYVSYLVTTHVSKELY
jgi:sorting nexin-4